MLEVTPEMKAAAAEYKRRIAGMFMLVEPKNLKAKLSGSDYCVTRKIDGIMAYCLVKDGNVAIVGTGTLDAVLVGGDHRAPRMVGDEVIVHLDNCVLINRTIIPIKENHIRYVFSKGSYLNFINREPGESWHPYVEDFDGAYNAIEFQGPETLKELLRRRHDEIRAMLQEP